MHHDGPDSFAHTPLESPDRMIRLLEARANIDGTFDFSLKTHILGSRRIPPFYALSYEWGPERPIFPITIDGKRFSVRENLRNFLDRIESGGEDFIRPLWIDAICIDQTKVAERNEQVKIMGQIFSAASLVLAWIGPKTVENAALAEITVELHQWAATPEYAQLCAGTLTSRPKLLSTQEPFGTMWNHLHVLCISSSYWNRLWVIQELIKADNKLLLVWGIEQISWRILSIAFKTIYEAGRGRRPSTTISGHWDIVESSVPYSVWMHSQGLQRKHGLLQTMDIYRESKCSVNHDKAYALTGISADSELLQIDYNKSLPDLYADLMNLEPRTPQVLRYSHLVLEALHIEEGIWERSGLKGQTVQCDAEKLGMVLSVIKLGINVSAELIQTEVWQAALEADWRDLHQVDLKSEWVRFMYNELRQGVGSFPGANVFCLSTGQMGITLLPTMVGDAVYRVQGLSKYSCKIDLKYSGPGSDSAATRVWLTEESTQTGQEVREQCEVIDLDLGDLYSMDHLLEIDFVVDWPSSPTDEASPSPLSAPKRAQSDLDPWRLHRSSTLSETIDEAMRLTRYVRPRQTWPKQGKLEVAQITEHDKSDPAGESRVPSLTEGTSARSSGDPFYDMAKSPPTGVDMVAVRLQNDEDIRSVVSLEDSIISKGEITGERSSSILAAEYLLARVFASHPPFKETCKLAIGRMPRERLAKNLRRLLGAFHLDLLAEAVSLPERECTNFMKNLTVRERIADRFLSDIYPAQEASREAEDDRRIKHATSLLERWLDQMSHPTYMDGRKETEQFEPQLDDELPDVHSDKDELPHGMTQIPNVGSMERFLTSSAAFKCLLYNTQMFLTPVRLATICRILTSIHGDRISFENAGRSSNIDLLKGALEFCTASAWNWWPLQPPRRQLREARVRVLWQCHCGENQTEDVTVDDANFIAALLQARGPEPSHTDHLCCDRVDDQTCIKKVLAYTIPTGILGIGLMIATTMNSGSKTWATLACLALLLSAMSVKNLACGARESVRTVPSSPSTMALGNLALQSDTTGRPAAITVAHQQSPRPENVEMDGRTSLMIAPSMDATLRQHSAERSAWILFGVGGLIEQFDLDHLDARPSRMTNDYTFFKALKESHAKLKGVLRNFLSVWCLSHCDIVKFTKPEAFHVFRDTDGPDLPTQRFLNDYDFESRGAPLSVHEFQAGLSPCRRACPLSFAHKCVRRRLGRRVLMRIPKKRTWWPIEYDCDPQEAWGVLAREMPSALRVSLYQMLILLGPFGFWLWWLVSVDEREWQTASVPAATVISLQALFWTQLGVLRFFTSK